MLRRGVLQDNYRACTQFRMIVGGVLGGARCSGFASAESALAILWTLWRSWCSPKEAPRVVLQVEPRRNC